MAAFLAQHRTLRRRIVVVTPQTLRAAFQHQVRAAMTRAATSGLSRGRPLLSAALPPPRRLVRALAAAGAVLPSSAVGCG
ncbi:hypothetical protein J8J27_28255, partial [Mycobacterium tuberculosis]|nr:hypothetical protein [Mycobacterium tuberculosis]